MKKQTKEMMTNVVKSYLDDGEFSPSRITNQLDTIKSKMKDVAGFIERIENFKNDPEKTRFERSASVVYEVNWLQNSIMRMYQDSIELSNIAEETKAFARVLDFDKNAEEEI